MTGNCVPGALGVWLCSNNGFGACHTGGDTQITGATFIPPNPTSPLSVVTINLPSPPAPVVAGQKYYFTDGCTDPLLSPPALITGPSSAPLMTPPVIVLLAGILGLVGLLGLARLRWNT